jgi:hypothetical protein
MSRQIIEYWYAGHVDADPGDHAMYLQGDVCGCCGVAFSDGISS